MDPYVGEIRLMPYAFAPQDWLLCDGSLLLCTQYQALYAVIGFTYGNEGTTKFKLPDLRNAIPVGANSYLPGTVQLPLGQATGSAGVTLTYAQLPAHNHAMNGLITSTLANRLTAPAANARPSVVLFNGTTATTTAQQGFSTTNTPDAIFASQAISAFGATQPTAHPSQQPYLPLNFMIAYNGVFPSPD